MKRLLVCFTLAVLVLIAVFSCKKDKGNYIYKELDNITIDGVDSAIKVIFGDSLVIKPNVVQQNVSLADFRFKWYMFRSGAGNDTTTYHLSETKDLSITMNYPVGSYYLIFEVINKNTGIKQVKSVFLDISRNYQDGIILLEETPQGGDISQISLRGNVYRNLYSSVNGSFIPQPLGKFLGFYFDPGIDVNYPNFLYLTIANQSTIELDWNTYENRGSIDRLLGVKNNSIFELQSVRPVGGGFLTAMVIDSKIHINSGIDIPLFFEGIVPGDYTVSSNFVAPTNGRRSFFPTPDFVFYDEKNQKFSIYSGNSLASLKDFIDDNGAYGTPQYDINNLPNKTCIYAGNTNEYDTYNWFLKDKQTGKINLYKMGNLEYVSAAKGVRELPPNSHFEKAKFYASSTALPQIYYAEDNNIYLYNYISNVEKNIHSFPQGEIVTDIKMSVNRTAGFFNFSISDFTTGKIYISTYNGIEGKVYYYPILPTGELGVAQVYTGFGKIVSMYYK